MDDNLFFLLIRLYKKPTILFLIILEMEYLPNSPYNITCAVLFFTFNIYLIYKIRTIFATIAKSPKPHTSQPYVKIGAIIV